MENLFPTNNKIVCYLKNLKQRPATNEDAIKMSSMMPNEVMRL